MKPNWISAAAALVSFLCLQAHTSPILEETFESPSGWQKNVRGKGAIALVKGYEGKGLMLKSEDKAMVYYSRPLNLKQVAGRRITVRAKVKLDNVVVGEQKYSTAKLHIGIRSEGKALNRARLFSGTSDWHDEVLVAEIPKRAKKVVLDLGIQNGTGTAYYDNLVVDDGVKEHVILSIESIANTSFSNEGSAPGHQGFLHTENIDLGHLPKADVRLDGKDFYILTRSANYGRNCVALKGAARPELPGHIATVIPVDAKGKRLFFLQAAFGGKPGSSGPCLTYAIHYDDGEVVRAVMLEGRDIGSLENPQNLANWKIAWSEKQGARTIGLGVTEWKNPRPDVPIQFIRLSSPGTGAVPVVVAVSLDPVKAQPGSGRGKGKRTQLQ